MNPPGTFSAAGPENQGPVQDRWLEDFQDITLNQLVDEAIAKNPDLDVAAARVEAALALIDIAASALRPRVEGLADAREADQGFGSDYQITLGLEVGWEMDIWGRIRSAEAAAEQEALSAALVYEYARQSLAASVADAWYLAITAQKQLAIDQERLEVELLTEDIATKRVQLGVNTPIDEEIANANVKLAQDAVARSQLALTESARALEILLGRYPSAELEISGEFPLFRNPGTTGIPSELLERRPDLVAADRRVAAAFHRLDSAQAARLPRVFLSSSMGTLLNPVNSLWSIGSNLLAPLYTGGELEAQVEVRAAEQREALANYVGVALDAFREVESALANIEYLQEREIYLQEAEARLAEASRIAQTRYDAGLLTIFELTQTRRQYFETASQLLRVRSEQIRQRINLYLALGGSYSNVPTVPENQEFIYGE